MSSDLGHLEKKPCKIYENCTLLDKDGNFLSRCGRRRIESYLKRGLGDLVRDDPLTIKLKHIEKNFITDPYVLEEKFNRCVVCGTEEDLTKHHVIPSRYKIHFPAEKKNFNHHDVLILCIKCHREYELKAVAFHTELKDGITAPDGWSDDTVRKTGNIAEKILSFIPLSDEDEMLHQGIIRSHYGIECDVLITRKMLKELCKKGAASQVAKASAEILKKKSKTRLGCYIAHLWSVIEKRFGRRLTDEELKRLVEMRDGAKPDGFVNDSHRVAAKYDPQVFAEMWRRHFLDTMSPKFLPSGWSEKKPLGQFVPTEDKDE